MYLSARRVIRPLFLFFALHHQPDRFVPLFAHARDERHAVERKEAGTNLTVPETLESGLQLCAFVLNTVGIPEETAERVVKAARGRRIGILLGGAGWKGPRTGAKSGFGR